jgi:cell division protein FtsQ
MLTLLLAAISKKNKGQCKDYSISIKGVQNNFFIDKKDVEQLLMKATKGNIKGQSVSSFNLHGLEQMLEHNTWIDEAELYFDNKDVLHVTVTEKEPVARIFTTTGNSFYIDSLGRKIPLSDKLSARVPVFTGFPERKKMTNADSILFSEIRRMANYISKDPFWLSQVAQIDITPEKSFEMVPVVGSHLIKLGSGENIEQKFNRLMVFYKQVLSKTGFDKYKVIDVQYKGQVVASKYAGNAKVDSIQLKKNVEKLLRQSVDAQNDTIIRAMTPIIKLEKDSASAVDPSLKDNIESNSEQPNPNPLKSSLSAKPVVKPTSKPTDTKPKPGEKKKKPKAIMPKKPVEETNGGYN